MWVNSGKNKSSVTALFIYSSILNKDDGNNVYCCIGQIILLRRVAVLFVDSSLRINNIKILEFPYWKKPKFTNELVSSPSAVEHNLLVASGPKLKSCLDAESELRTSIKKFQEMSNCLINH